MSIPNFLSHPHTPVGRKMFMASVLRSTKRRMKWGIHVHEGEPGKVPLWWCTEPVPVKEGDRVLYFSTPFGLAFECVEAPPPPPPTPPRRDLGGVSSFRFS
ncbi:MAG: hypothetical protein AB7Q29_16070 [Vicinamibacterales bacterium]